MIAAQCREQIAAYEKTAAYKAARDAAGIDSATQYVEFATENHKAAATNAQAAGAALVGAAPAALAALKVTFAQKQKDANQASDDLARATKDETAAAAKLKDSEQGEPRELQHDR